MKHNLLVIVTALVCLLCPAWEEAAAETGCKFTGTINNEPSNIGLVFGDFYQYGSVVGTTVIGYDNSWDSGLHGSAYLPGGTFPVYITISVGPSSNHLFSRQIHMTVGPNLVVTGRALDIGLNGINTAAVTGIISDCQTAPYVFG